MRVTGSWTLAPYLARMVYARSATLHAVNKKPYRPHECDLVETDDGRVFLLDEVIQSGAFSSRGAR